MPQGDDTDPSVRDHQASLHLAREADPWIDFTRVNTDAERLMQHLSRRYEEVLSGLLAGARSDPDALQAVLKTFARQLARAQADIFVLKSAVLGRDRMVLTRDWEYRDPLQAHYAALGETLAAAQLRMLGRYSLLLDNNVVGMGWHETEQKGESFWRWSGPGLNATLMIPRFFGGPLRVEVMFDVVKRDALAPRGAIRLDGQETEYVLRFEDDSAKGSIVFDANLGEEQSPFFSLEFTTTRTYSPAREFGSSDRREVGICVRRLLFSAPPGRLAADPQL